MGIISRFPVPESSDLPIDWQSVFRQTDVPLWLEDIGAVRRAIDGVRIEGHTNFAAWLDAHPEFITRVIGLIHVVDVNDAAITLYGAADRDELIVSLERMILPDTLPAFKEFITALAAGAEYFEGEAHYLGLDDRPLYTLNRAWLPPPDEPVQHMVFATVDITGLKLAQRALAESENSYRLLIESAGDMILRHDLSGRITFINQTGLDLLGVGREAILGRNARELFTGNGAPADAARRHGSGAGTADIVLYETIFHDGRGRSVPLEVSSTVIANPAHDGGEPQVLLCARNISARKHSEHQKVVLDGRVRAAQKLESLASLAGTVAHDFNNMLGVIMGNAELAATLAPPDSEVVARLSTILGVAEEAADLCRQMQTYAGSNPLARESCDLSEILRRSQRLLESSAGSAAGIHFQLADDLPLVLADPAQINQVMLNLIANATEACSGHGGEIVIRTGRRELGADDLACLAPGSQLAPGPYVYCDVGDSGPGMDPTMAAKIFDPFYTTKDAGRGLGLSAALGIIRGHGGGFIVDPEPGRGTTLTFLLPAPSTEVAERPRKRREPQRPLHDLRGHTVLVVEREPAVRAVAVSFLRRLGCGALAAGDGFEAVRLFGVRHADIDAVILDLNMPGLDGPDACRRLLVIRPEVPVIFTSGAGPAEVAEKAAGCGYAGFVAKPFKLKEIRNALGAVLAPRPDRSGGAGEPS